MKLSIKRKLLAGFTLILVLLISMSFLMINKFSESNDRLQSSVDVYSKKINLSNELMIAVLDVARQEKNIILEKDIVQKDYSKDLIYKALETIDKKTNELEELVDDKGKVFLKEFEATWASYQLDLKNIISFAMKNEDEEASKISTDKGLKVREEAISQLQRLIDKNQKSMPERKFLDFNKVAVNGFGTYIIIVEKINKPGDSR